MRHSTLQILPTFTSLPKTCVTQPHSQHLHLPKPKRLPSTITMRDRSKNPRPLQKGRNLSIEAIQTIQALKRAQKTHQGCNMNQVFESKFRRLLKLDMMAVLKDLLRQNECFLALKVFEDIRKEYWYKPQVLLYADMIKVMACNELFEQIEFLCLCLRKEDNLQPDVEGFRALLTTLMSFRLHSLVMECYCLMKGVGCEPDRSLFKVLIKGLESMGETGSLGVVRKDAQTIYGESLEFLEEDEEMAAS